MNLLTWNCRWLGSPRTVHELTKVIRIFKPQIVFLIETKRKKTEMEWLLIKWEYDSCLVVDSVGKAGGPALLWKQELHVGVLSYSNSHIDAKVNGDTVGDSWRFTRFYGHFQTHKRVESWNLLRSLHE